MVRGGGGRGEKTKEKGIAGTHSTRAHARRRALSPVDAVEDLHEVAAHVAGDGAHHPKVVVQQPPGRVDGHVAGVLRGRTSGGRAVDGREDVDGMNLVCAAGRS
jgi:hypothetical protein